MHPHPCRLEGQQREAQALAKQLSQLHAETSRLNSLLAQAAGQRSALREDNTALEAKLTAELKVGVRIRVLYRAPSHCRICMASSH